MSDSSEMSKAIQVNARTEVRYDPYSFVPYQDFFVGISRELFLDEQTLHGNIDAVVASAQKELAQAIHEWHDSHRSQNQ